MSTLHDCQTQLVGLEARRNMLLDQKNHFDGDNPHLNESEKKEELWQIECALRFVNETIDRTKQYVESIHKMDNKQVTE